MTDDNVEQSTPNEPKAKAGEWLPPEKSAASSIGEALLGRAAAFGRGAVEAAQSAGTAIAAISQQAGGAAAVGASKVGEAVASASRVVADAAKSVGETAKTVVTTLADENGDRRVDQEDVALLTKKAAKSAKDFAATDLGKKTIAGAALGAAVGTAVPIVGTVIGGVAGAASAACVHLHLARDKEGGKDQTPKK